MTSEVGRERVAALSAMGSADWETMQEFCRLFLTVDSLQKFRELVASNTREGSTFRAKFERLSGLAVFLERYCSDEERNKFFSSTLKFIASYASSLRERLPEMGIPCLRAQESEFASKTLARVIVLFPPSPCISLFGLQRCLYWPWTASACVSFGERIPLCIH